MSVRWSKKVRTMKEAKRMVAALAVLGAANVKLSAHGWWRCTKDGESMDLREHPVLASRGERVRVRVSTPEGMEEVWAIRGGYSEGNEGWIIVEAML